VERGAGNSGADFQGAAAAVPESEVVDVKELIINNYFMKFSRKDSEHADIYANRKFTRIEDDFRPQTPEDAQDDTYKFKRTIELSKSYELYLETEKAYMTFKANGQRWWDPMETLI